MELAALADRYANNTTSRIVEFNTAGRRRSMTYAELGILVKLRAEHLRTIGVGTGDVVGLCAKNSIDWIVWDLATAEVGALVQAFPDDTAVTDPDEFLARHGLTLLVLDSAEGIDHGSVTGLADPPNGQVPAPARRRIAATDLHSRVYSSGTSGRLKGLDISRSGTEYVIGRFLECFTVTAVDRHLIFLPLANYQQRLSVYCCLWTGADLVLAPYQRVFSTLRSESPTFMIAPPVFYDALWQLFSTSGGSRSLTEFLGGRIRFMITGMAPIRRATLEAFWDRGVKLLEAYGLTECGMIAWNVEDAYRLGSVGRLIDPESVEFQPDGELLIRRAAPLSLGYFTADSDPDGETFRPDGAIGTGDYGDLDADGFLTLKGRKKDVIALGNGQKVHPAEIESAFTGIAGVAEVVVVPTPQSNRLGAIVTPSTPADETLRASIRHRVEQVNETLEPHKRVLSVLFSERPLQSDPRFLTGNLKLSRPVATAYFAELVAAADPPPPEPAHPVSGSVPPAAPEPTQPVPEPVPEPAPEPVPVPEPVSGSGRSG